MRKKSDKPINKTNHKKIFLISFLSTVCSVILIGLFFMYGPISYFRDLWVTSAMTTLNHKYLATLLYSKDTIDKILAANSVENITEITDSNMIVISDKDVPKFKLDPIVQDGFEGFMLSISNPAWVRMGISAKYGEKGQRLSNMVKDYNALAAINASGFIDVGGQGLGGKPTYLIVQDHKIINNCTEKTHRLICFDEKNKLILGNFTKSDLEKYNIRDGVEFGPFLIVNNKPATVRGNGGWGLNPRTAIGQKADGTVLFLVIDGRRPGHSIGATMKDLQNIMLKYGAVNAANLDGGSSSSMNFDGELITRPSGPDGERFLPNAFMVVSEGNYNKAQADRKHILDKIK